MPQANRTASILTVVGVALIVVFLLGGLGMMGFWPAGYMGRGMMWGYGPASAAVGGWGWVMMGVGMLAMLAFWGAVIVGVVLVARWLLTQASAPSAPPAEDSLAILNRRYAAGEITREQYEEIRQTIAR